MGSIKPNNFYLGLDQGSGSSKAILIDEKGNDIFTKTFAVKTTPSLDSKVEQDPLELFNSILGLVNEAKNFAKAQSGNIVGVGMSLQRSGVLAWNREGAPLTPLLTWRDARVKEDLQKLEAHKSYIYNTSGLPLTYHYAALKIALLQKRFPKDYVGTLDAFFIYKMSGEKIFATEESHASRSQLYSLAKRTWDPELCKIFGVDPKRLPQIHASFNSFGTLDELPVVSLMGDQSAAFYALNKEGHLTLVVGTVASFIIPSDQISINIGYHCGVSHSKKDQVQYQLEASINASGFTMDYLKEKLKLKNGVKDINLILEKHECQPSEAVAFFPFQSSGSPDWRTDLKNFFSKEPTSEKEMVCALIENIGNWIALNLEQLKKINVIKAPLKITVAGGGSGIDYLTKHLTTLSQAEIYRVANYEGSAYGAALSALSANSLKNITPHLKTEKISSDLDSSVIKQRYEIWKRMRESEIKE